MPITVDQLRAAAARYQTSTPSDREWGTDSLTQTYLNDTPLMTIHAFACGTLQGRACTCGNGNAPRVLREWPNLFRKPVRVPTFANWLGAVEMSKYVKHTYGDEYAAYAFPNHKKIVRVRDGKTLEVKGSSWKECLDKAQSVFHWIPRLEHTEPKRGAFTQFVAESNQPARRLDVSVNGQIGFWAIGEQVYYADSSAQLDAQGQPAGKRWFCTLAHWERLEGVSTLR